MKWRRSRPVAPEIPPNLLEILRITIEDQRRAGQEYRADWEKCLAEIDLNALKGIGRDAVLDFFVKKLGEWRLPNECRYG